MRRRWRMMASTSAAMAAALLAVGALAPAASATDSGAASGTEAATQNAQDAQNTRASGSATSTDTAPPTDAGDSAPIGSAAASAIETQTIDLMRQSINHMRRDHGLAPLIPSVQIDASARAITDTMATQGENPDPPSDLGPHIPGSWIWGWGTWDFYRLPSDWTATDIVQEITATIDPDGDGASNSILAPEMTHVGLSFAIVPRGSQNYVYYQFITGQYPEPTHGADESVMYRFYRPDLGVHFYTTSKNELDQVLYYPQYRYEGVAGIVKNPDAAGGGLASLHRFYKPGVGTHFYTPSDYEASLAMGYPDYRYESVSAKVFAAPASGTTPMYRFYKPAQGTHFYTASAEEAAQVRTYPEYREESAGTFHIVPARVFIT